MAAKKPEKTRAEAIAEKIHNQQAAHNFFVQRYKSQEPFAQADVANLTTWKKKTLGTYWSKQFKAFLVPAGSGLWRVGEGWRNYSSWEKFQAHVTQVRRASQDYSLLLHDSLLVYEFYMPLTNETHLRTSLDSLFYRDTLANRLKGLDQGKVREQFAPEASEADEAYTVRLCDWLAKKFAGYSIATVSGRFRGDDLLSMADAVTSAKEGRRYLIDETTAMVRFVFPCGKPLKRPPPDATEQFTEPDWAEPDADAQAEAQRIRWFFRALFVRTILQVVNAEAEIWMVESGMRNRLHIWKVDPQDVPADDAESNDAESDQDLLDGADEADE